MSLIKSSFIAVIALTFLKFSYCTFLAKPNVTDISYKVYSLVFSAKYYNPVEKKTFFFAIPFSFATEMKIDKNNTIHLNFIRADNQKEILNVVREE